MRKYAVLYIKELNTWNIIFQDEYEDTWYLEADDVTRSFAEKAVESLNNSQQEVWP